MKIILSFIGVFILGLFLTPYAHAIIFLPAIILIPIAKIIAIVLGLLSIPTISFGALWSKLFKKSTKRTISVITLMLIIAAVLIAVILKIENPNRPLF